MKNARHFTFLILMLSVLFVSAQRASNEMTLQYDLTVESSDNKTELTKAFEGAKLTIQLKGNQSRNDMKSALGTESSIFDGKTGKGYILKEYSGQKLMITMTRDNWKQKNNYYQSLDFKLVPGDETINGFKTKKAIADLPNGKKLTVYYSSEIVAPNTEYNNAFRLPGVPVQYEVESGKLKFKYLLSKVSTDPIASAIYEIPKSGYRVMTYDENQQLKKGD